MEDIIFSMAWRCDDKDCKAQWHKSNYWCYSDGTYSVDRYSDGDHEDADEADLPSNKEVEGSWLDYSRHVLATGDDPLGEFFVDRTRKVQQRWEVKFARSILGPMVVAVRRNKGAAVKVDDLPKHVIEYLNCDSRGVLTRLSWDELIEAQPGIRERVWFHFVVYLAEPRPAELIEKELKRLARRHLNHPRTQT